MKTSPLFQPTPADIDRLVAAHPLAQLVSNDAGAMLCTPLPLLLERGPDDTVALLGHFARANPQVAALRRDPRALVVFLGAHGYVSPSWMRDRSQAPTWNFETVHFQVEVEFDESPDAIHEALTRLVAHVERDRPAAWSETEMGARYAQLSRAVVAFRARVTATVAKFKLGQNERADVYEDILAGLAGTGQQALADAMRRMPRPAG